MDVKRRGVRNGLHRFQCQRREIAASKRVDGAFERICARQLFLILYKRGEEKDRCMDLRVMCRRGQLRSSSKGDDNVGGRIAIFRSLIRV